MDQLHSKIVKENRYGYVTVGVKDHYKLYKNSVKNPINDSKLYNKVLGFIFIRIWNYMFKEKWVFKPPCNFGHFYVAESLTSGGFYKDWGKSSGNGKIVKSYNLHTAGRQFYIKWNKLISKIRNQQIYKFHPYRGNKDELSGKRGLAAWIKHCANDPYLNDFRGHII